MKINPQQMKLVESLYREQKQAAPRRGSREGGGGPMDRVTISEESQEIQGILSQLKAVPEVREQKVAELRAAVRQGTYQVPARKVAEKLLEQILRDEL
jgi:negative regulator of flagellin synthesis FlgM